jgi:arsenate reductase
VAFVCVHNSCRSQIAEAFSKEYTQDAFDSFSAGTEPSGINPDAARLLASVYGMDIGSERSKHINELPEIDIVVTMGCGVACPNVRCKHSEDWGIEDPTGSDDDVFMDTMEVIRKKVLDLRGRVLSGTL